MLRAVCQIDSERAVIAYMTLVGVAFSALLGAPWWTALIGGSVLAAISIAEQQKLRARFSAIGASEVLAMAGLASLANGWIAGAAAWGVGKFSWWIWMS